MICKNGSTSWAAGECQWRCEALKRKYHNPRNLPPSARLVLAEHQTGRDIGDLIEPLLAGRLVIDDSDQAIAACRRALIEADDQRRGVMRFCPEDLLGE